MPTRIILESTESIRLINLLWEDSSLKRRWLSPQLQQRFIAEYDALILEEMRILKRALAEPKACLSIEYR